MYRPHTNILIIGGGINGLGTFRDLALQGVDVTLVERGDFVSGASSASSHMIHGGLRYLENGEFHLVKEAVSERNILLRIAPHFVKPLRTTIPIFSIFPGLLAAPLRILTHRVPRKTARGALIIKLGLVIYDLFSRAGGTLPRHVFHGASAMRQEFPDLNTAAKCTATYFDASVQEPERLALDVLFDGLATGPHARAANYVEATDTRDGTVLLRDVVNGKVFTFAAGIVINASGAWTDLTNGALGEPTYYMGGTKGSHIVLDHPQLLKACAGREWFFENSDGRIVLVYPLRGKVMVGTSDLEVDVRGPVRCTEEEIDYFINLVGYVFPGIPIDRSQIIYRFSGVRPLPSHGGVKPGFVSRDYRIVPSSPKELNGVPVLSLVGGKFTTFRAASEHLANEALKRLGIERTVDTDDLAIGGGKDYPMSGEARQTWIATHGEIIGSARAKCLLSRYGTRAVIVIQYLEKHGDTPLESTDELSVEELQFMAENEYVVHVHDVLLRRTNLAFDGKVSVQVIDAVARVLATSLGWSRDRTSSEVAEACRVMTEEHGVVLGFPGFTGS